MAAMFTAPNGSSELHEGDRFLWYSTPSAPGIGPGEAFRRTVGYDVDDLMAATGWSRERAEAWADTEAGPVPLAKLLPDVPLPPELAERPAHEMRAFNTWRFRVERADRMTVSFYIRAVRPER